MLQSIWRYSHFLLAAVAAVFLVLASVTGAILAFEPITQKVQPYATISLDQVEVNPFINSLKATYDEVIEVKITPEDFVTANVVTADGDYKTIYVNPSTAETLEEVMPPSDFFKWVTNFHRSLFLKSVGRAFVGIFSFLLVLIAISGVFLLAQRQGGFKKWFTPVQEKNINQRYHVILSRWFLIPILIIAVTAVYLSADKFALLPDAQISHNWNAPQENIPATPVTSFDVLKDVNLDQVRQINFPFSSDPEDYYQVALDDRELLIHQYSGTIISEQYYPFVAITTRWSTFLHTGTGSYVWSVVLLLASLSILFFMYSGFAMSIKRMRKSTKLKTHYSKDEASIVLLVGSESGGSFAFAKAYYKQLLEQGSKAYIATLNEYSTYAKATKLVVFTATYGDGDAPSNARKFERLFHEITPVQEMEFAVLGFGSSLYPKFCQFAVQVDDLLNGHEKFHPLVPLHKVDDHSETDLQKWTLNWNESTGMNLVTTTENLAKNSQPEVTFKVVHKTVLNIDQTMLLRLRPTIDLDFQSGDLLNVLPPEEEKIRQYSIARIDNDILLSIKKHDLGICSSYLCDLSIDQEITASIQYNQSFHFPTDAPSVWLIGNGTGIAPFLGMLKEAQDKTPIELIWGGRRETSFDIYRDIIPNAHHANLQIALSQEGNKIYVQQLLQQQAATIATALKSGTVFMICGSLAMQHEVLDALEKITTDHLSTDLTPFELNGQILMDCY